MNSKQKDWNLDGLRGQVWLHNFDRNQRREAAEERRANYVREVEETSRKQAAELRKMDEKIEATKVAIEAAKAAIESAKAARKSS